MARKKKKRGGAHGMWRAFNKGRSSVAKVPQPRKGPRKQRKGSFKAGGGSMVVKRKRKR